MSLSTNVRIGSSTRMLRGCDSAKSIGSPIDSACSVISDWTARRRCGSVPPRVEGRSGPYSLIEPEFIESPPSCHVVIAGQLLGEQLWTDRSALGQPTCRTGHVAPRRFHDSRTSPKHLQQRDLNGVQPGNAAFD